MANVAWVCGSRPGRRGDVVVGTEDGRLVAIDPVTGALTVTLRASGAVHSPPLILDGPVRRIVWGARDGVIRAFDLRIDESPWDWKR